METIQFIVALFLLMMVWAFVLRKSFLDKARDELFDLRDELRKEYVSNGWSLNSATYRQARDLINAYLRLTEDFSVWRIVYTQAAIASNPALSREITTKAAALFSNVPAAQAKFVQKIRHRSLHVVMGFAVFNSFPLYAAGALLMPFLLAERIFSALRRGGRVFFTATYQSLAHFESTLISLSGRAADVVARIMFQPSVVEGYSMRRAKA